MRIDPGMLVLALLLGCAPSERALLRHRHYPEALAGVQDAALDGPPVIAAIVDALEVGLHVQAVSAEQLRASLPGAPDGFDDLALVRIVHASHAITLHGYEVDVALRQDGVEVQAIDTSIVALAQRSHEPLPEPKIVHHEGQPGGVSMVQTTRFPIAELLLRGVFNIATLGLAHDAVPLVHDDSTPDYTTAVPPSPDEYARAAPAATTLSSWMHATTYVAPGDRVEDWRLWPREGSGPASLHIEVALDMARLRCDIPLPAEGLELGLATLFGERERRLVELCEPELEYDVHVEFHEEGLRRPALRRLEQRVPAWLTQPELRIDITCESDDVSLRRAEQLRRALLSFGVPADALHIDSGATVAFWPHLRVRHRLTPPAR